MGLIPVINVLLPLAVPSERNRGIYQRLQCLSADHKLRLWTLHDVEVAPELSSKIEIIRFPWKLGKLEKLFYNLWVMIYLGGLIKRQEREIVYCVNHRQYLLGYLFKVVFNTRWVIDFFHSPFYRLDVLKDKGLAPAMLHDKILAAVFTKILKRVDVALVMSHSQNEGFCWLIRRKFAVASQKIIAIPDGVDIGLANSILTKAGNQHHENGLIRIIHVGAINRKKFIWAMPLLTRLLEEYPQVRVTLRGAALPPLQQEVEAWAHRHAERIRFSQVSHAQALREIAEADIGLCILDDGIRDYHCCHPNKVFEYMAMGIAVVASRLEGIEGIIDDGVTGLLYQCGDEDDFLRKMRLLISNRDLRRTMGAQAKEKVKRFDWTRLNNILVEKFNRLMQ